MSRKAAVTDATANRALRVLERRGKTDVQPRLLTLEQAAAYLSLPLATTRNLGIGRVCLGTKTRYDRAALDAHLDELGGLAPQSPVAEDDDPEAALGRFARRFQDVAGRA